MNGLFYRQEKVKETLILRLRCDSLRDEVDMQNMPRRLESNKTILVLCSDRTWSDIVVLSFDIVLRLIVVIFSCG